MTDPLMADFVAELESVNALADSAPGFVWRLQTEAGDATAIRPYDDDTILINMSVWETVEALKAFVYRTHHADVMRQREKWFERLDAYFIALWWVAQSLWNVSVYVKDARAQELPLVGGGEHDWAYLLGELDLLPHDQAIGHAVWLAGVVVYLIAIAIGLNASLSATEEVAEPAGLFESA